MADLAAPTAGAPRRASPSVPPNPKTLGGEAGYLTGGALLLAGFVLALANFMVILDTTIANVSVPNIAGGLGVSANEGTWVITSYSVAEAITVPLTGWLAQRFGSVRTFAVAMCCFGLCSALCGLAPSLGVLVVFRVLQGLSGGPMIPLSQTLLLRVFPKKMAPQALAIWSMTTLIGPIAGPILGGLICDNSNWSWIFFINVPFALICSFLAWRLLRTRETPTLSLPIDFVGLGLLVVFVGALQIMLDQGENLDWFQSPFIISLLITTVIGFVAFLIWELTAENPVVNLKVFRYRGYTTCLIVMCLCFGAYFAAVVITPLWLQTNMGYTATWAGFALAPSGVLAVFMAPMVARMMAKIDARLLIFIGVLGLAGTMFWRTGFAGNITFSQIVAPQFVQGIFMPLFFVPLFGVALSFLKPQDITSGAGLLSFTRTMAAAFSTSIAATFWNNTSRASRVQLLNQMDSSQALHQLRLDGLGANSALYQLERLVAGQGVMLATDTFFLCLGVVMVLAAFSIWVAPKPIVRGGPGGGH
jgi:DHA2 family multidrug resistance protein